MKDFLGGVEDAAVMVVKVMMAVGLLVEATVAAVLVGAYLAAAGMWAVIRDTYKSRLGHNEKG